MDDGKPAPWQAVLTPHRSLSRHGFLLVMGAIAAINFILGTMFWSIGAWPVAGFLGLDVLAIWWAFRVNFADALRAERITVTDHEVVLERQQLSGFVEQSRFVRRWVRVELDEDIERELVGHLYLVAQGRRSAVGAFLPPDERKAFSGHLKAAVAIPRI